MMSYLIWHTHSDLNREQQFWRLSCYHYTIGINKKGGSLPVAVRIAHFVEDFKPSEPSLFFRFFVRWPQLIVPLHTVMELPIEIKLKKAPIGCPANRFMQNFLPLTFCNLLGVATQLKIQYLAGTYQIPNTSTRMLFT